MIQNWIPTNRDDNFTMIWILKSKLYRPFQFLISFWSFSIEFDQFSIKRLKKITFHDDLKITKINWKIEKLNQKSKKSDFFLKSIYMNIVDLFYLFQSCFDLFQSLFDLFQSIFNFSIKSGSKSVDFVTTMQIPTTNLDQKCRVKVNLIMI